MKIAIISDIHGNLQALESVVADAEENDVDEFYCLGDIVGYGGDPSSCVNFIRALGCRCVKGNHDAVATGYSSPMNIVAKQAIDWTVENLTDEQLGWLQSLPMTMAFDEDAVLVHGSIYNVGSYHYILEDGIVGMNFAIQEDYNLRVCFLGHSHLECGIMYSKVDSHYSQMLDYVNEKPVGLDDDHLYIFNPGSVGQPRGGSWKAHYALVEMESSGKVGSVSLRRVEYDIEKAATRILSAGLHPFLAFRLLEGWKRK